MRVSSRLLSCTCIVAMVYSCLLAVGCSHGHVTQEEVDNPAQVDEIVIDGILLRLTTNKTTSEPGENVMITVYVENQSSQAIHYKYAEHHIHLDVRSSDPNYWIMLGKDGQKYIVETWITNPGVLNAGESITLETFWDQKWMSGIDASLGRYTLRASFMGLPDASVGVNIWAGSYENGVNRGAWLHDEEGRVWYQEAQLNAAPKEYGDAVRAKQKHREMLEEIPGLNAHGITRYPFPDGNWVISIDFRSQAEFDDAMERDIIPPFLDGVPVLVDDSPGPISLA